MILILVKRAFQKHSLSLLRLLLHNIRGWRKSNWNLFLTVLDAEKFKIKALTDSVSSESQLLVCPLPISSPGRKVCGISFTRAPSPFMNTQPSWPNHIPNISPSDTNTLGIRISTYQFWRTQHPVHNKQFFYF